MNWMVLLFILVLIPLVAAVLDSPLGRALAARVERSGAGDGEGLGRRVAALEAETERLADEVRQLREESEFLRRLLEGRSSSNPLPPGEQRG
jgi:cell division protein FtsB